MSSTTTAPRVALITGAAGGLGRAMALRLARDGLDVALADLPNTPLDDLKSEIEKLGRRACVLRADVTVESEVEGMVSGAVEALGSVDVVIANAGIVVVGTVLTLSVEEMKRLLDINVVGVFHCYKYAAKQMIAQGRGGRIVGASSLAGKHGYDFLAGYCTSKFAVRGLTQAAASELGKHGITVNAYAPGLVETSMIGTMDAALAPVLNGGSVRDISKTSAMGRMGEPEDVANLVSYLCSPGATHITGQTITLDGGIYYD